MNIQTVTHQGLSFLQVHDPQDLELKFLRKNYGFSPLNLEDYINKTQIPKIEIYKDYTLIVLDFPYFENPTTAQSQNSGQDAKQPSSNNSHFPHISLPTFQLPSQRKRLRAGHVNFYIGKDYLVVLHDAKTPQIDEIFSLCQKALKHRQEFMSEGPVFLFYRLVDVLVDSSFAVVNEISTGIENIDNLLIENRSKDIVEDISITRRDIVVYQTMIKPALPIFSDLEKGKYKELNSSMTPFWSNILDHIQKIWDRLEDSRELIEGISESNESLLTARTNEIIKVLTMFSAILLPLNLVASMYGMNIVDLPFAHDPIALPLIMLTMFALAAVMIIGFKFRNWL